jgi:hypothetical protein
MLPQFNTIYNRIEDEVARLAEITIGTGTTPSDPYGPEALVDENPALVAKIDSTTGRWVFQYDSPQRIDIVDSPQLRCRPRLTRRVGSY